MNHPVKAKLVKVGNSMAVRIPKVILDQLQLGPDVEITVQSDGLVIRPAHHCRAGWDEQFQAMATAGDDQLLADVPTHFEAEAWEW
jgi:antitoxin MazE